MLTIISLLSSSVSAEFIAPIGRNLARQSSNINFLYQPDRPPRTLDFAATFEYERTFNEKAFDPIIENFIEDLNFKLEFGGFSETLDGLYFRVNAPFAHTRLRIPDRPSKVDEPKSGILDKVDFTFLKKSRLVNLDLILGYNFLQDYDYHLGLYFLAIAPTDHWRIFANRKWQVGGGLQGHYELWSCGADNSVTAYFEGYATRLVHARRDSARSWLTNLMSAVQGEALFQLIYRNGGWSLGGGYNFYGSSKEKITLNSESDILNDLAAQAQLPFLTADELDHNGFVINPGLRVHRLFGHIDYAWFDSPYTPFIGLGGQVDLAQKRKFGINNFGIWLKGGISF